MKNKESWLDAWRECYVYVIPTLVLLAYLVAFFLYGFDLTKSIYLVDALSGIVTAIAIMTGLLSALLGAVVQAKESSRGIKFFFCRINKEKFVSLLKRSVLSGFTSIFLSCMLFFADILGAMASNVIAFVWIWSLMHYLATTYRFSNIFVALLVTDKKEIELEEAKEPPGIDEDALKKRISKKHKNK